MIAQRTLGLIGIMFCLMIVESQAQQRASTYTLIQGGGLYGVSNSKQDPLHGYQFQFVIGRNMDDRYFVGLGVGNDIYRGAGVSGGSRGSRVSFLPLFIDYRMPIVQMTAVSRLGMMANAGYAPRIGGDFYDGGMGKVGLTYSQLLIDRSDVHISLGYGFQQFNSKFIANRFHQRHVFLTVGLFVY